MKLTFKPGFDPTRIVWSRPDSRIAPLCSLCCEHIPDDAVPLMMWQADGTCCQFCDRCIDTWLTTTA